MTSTIEVLHPGDTRASRLGEGLGRAFHDEPNFAHIVPDGTERADALTWFFGVFVVQLGWDYGTVYVTKQISGGAVWMSPASNVSFMGAVRAGLLRMPFHFGWMGFRRSMELNSHLEKVREQTAPAYHWYLAALGVAPEEQGRGLGGALIQPALAQADLEGTPCYLETFSERNVSFYRRRGFKVVVEDRVPKTDLRFWGMTRLPQTVCSTEPLARMRTGSLAVFLD